MPCSITLLYVFKTCQNIEFFLILVEISVSVCPTTPGAGVSNTETVSPKASKLHQGILQQTKPPYTKLYSFRFS